MINVLATTSKSKFASQLLKKVEKDCDKNKQQNMAFISTELLIKDFFQLTHSTEEYLVHDYTDITKNGKHLNATISLPKSSLLFIDFPDKSYYRAEEGVLDIQQLRTMIIPLKYRYNVKDIYIDNFESVTCNLMGRDLLWKTKNLGEAEDWKDRQMEYKMALLFYMSRKFNLNFHIGMTWYGNEKKPKDIRFMTYGYIFDMVDQINFNNTVLHKYSN